MGYKEEIRSLRRQIEQAYRPQAEQKMSAGRVHIL